MRRGHLLEMTKDRERGPAGKYNRDGDSSLLYFYEI